MGDCLQQQHFNNLQHLGFVLEAIVVIPIGTLLSWLPWTMVNPLARIAGTLLFHLAQKDRQQAYQNLDIVFADNLLAEVEKERIGRNLFINLVRVALEFLKIGDLTAQNYGQFLRLENPEAQQELDRVLGMKKGALNITAHIGNWEYLASASAKVGNNTAGVINRQLNPYTDRWLKGIREHKGKVRCYYNETSGLIGVVKHLKHNGLVGILADEAASSAGIEVPFFGRETATPSGPAKFHLRYGVPLMFNFCVRQDDGKYLICADGPYHFERSDDFENDCRAIMTLVNQKYEAIIRKYPDQWFSLFYPKWTGRQEH
jgi:Kdo2-lipid IVA lauroyltransferase/acyltransferase